ncbi:saccharopine dehydrogenase NADP-binding domain-containing protein [Calditrichota bacterium]
MPEKTILVLGGYGETGRRIASHLMTRTDARLVLVGRNGEKAKQLAAELNSRFEVERARGLRCDVNDIATLPGLFEGADFFVQAGPALPVNTVRALAKSVIENHADWMDVQLDPKQTAVIRELESKIMEQGCCFAIQGGFHPGVPAALVRWAAARMDSITEAYTAGFINPKEGLILTSGVDELIDLFSNYDTSIFKDGAWINPGMSMSAMRDFNFGFGIGKQTTSPMNLDEMQPLPELYPTLKNTGFYVGGFDRITNYLTIPLMMAGIKLFPKVKAYTWGKLLCWSHKTFNRPPYGTCLKLEASGLKDDKPIKIELSILHDDEYELTAIPMVSTIEQMISGSVKKPGVHFMAHLTEPEKLFSDMSEMGVKLEQTPLS